MGALLLEVRALWMKGRTIFGKSELKHKILKQRHYQILTRLRVQRSVWKRDSLLIPRTLFQLGVYIALRSRWYTPDTHVARLTFQHCPTVAPSFDSRRWRNWCQKSSREMASCFTVACQPGASEGVTDENYWARCLDTVGRAVRNFTAVAIHKFGWQRGALCQPRPPTPVYERHVTTLA